MSKQQVVASEGRKPDIQEPNLLIYSNVEAGEFKTNLLYKFNSQGLIAAIYLIKAKHSTDAAYFEDYKHLLATLTDKYGTPQKNEENWIDELYKNDPQRYGLAVASGHVSFANQWTTDNTLVYLVFKGDNFKTDLTVWYTYASVVAEPNKTDTKDF